MKRHLLHPFRIQCVVLVRVEGPVIIVVGVLVSVQDEKDLFFEFFSEEVEVALVIAWGEVLVSCSMISSVRDCVSWLATLFESRIIVQGFDSRGRGNSPVSEATSTVPA